MTLTLSLFFFVSDRVSELIAMGRLNGNVVTDVSSGASTHMYTVLNDARPNVEAAA